MSKKGHILRVTLDESAGEDAGPSLVIVARRINELGGSYFGGRMTASDYVRRWIKSIPCLIVERKDGRAQFADDVDLDSLLSFWSFNNSSELTRQFNDGIDPRAVTALVLYDTDPADMSLPKWPFASAEEAISSAERVAAMSVKPSKPSKSLVESIKDDKTTWTPDPSFRRATTPSAAISAMDELLQNSTWAADLNTSDKSEITYKYDARARERGNKQTVEDAVNALLGNAAIGTW